MTSVDLSSTSLALQPTVETEANGERDSSLSYLLGFAAVGLFFSILSFAVTPAELLPEGSPALVPEMQTFAGPKLLEIEIPAGLKSAEYPAH
jgi:hypothetical protein